MTAHGKVEASQSVSGKRVTSALKDNGSRLVVFHDAVDHRLEDALVAVVVDAVAEREVNGVVLSVAHADIPKFAGAREVLSVLVERDCHDAVGAVEGFFDTITVVHINVDVEHARVETEELDDAEDDVCGMLEIVSQDMQCCKEYSPLM